MKRIMLAAGLVAGLALVGCGPKVRQEYQQTTVEERTIRKDTIVTPDQPPTPPKPPAKDEGARRTTTEERVVEPAHPVVQ